MIGVYIHVAGILSLLIASIIGNLLINKNTSKEKISSVSQFVLIVLNLVIFGAYFLVFFVPGLDEVDKATSLDKIPVHNWLRMAVGIVLILVGIVVYYITVDLLIKRGKGFSAYKFTKNVISESIYKYVRNPMSVGYYLFALGFPFLFDSLYLLIITVIGFIPVQLLYVLIYEEKELKLRFGPSYFEYSKGVPRFFPNITAIRRK